jgi:protoheme ferro-lyase
MKNALLMMAYGSPERKEDIMDYLRERRLHLSYQTVNSKIVPRFEERG